MSDRAGTPARPPLSAILFDLRGVIGLLFTVYGVVLTVLGLFVASYADLAKAGGVNLNLWTGLAMLIGGIIFYTWVFTKPPMPPSRSDVDDAEQRPHGH
jgi:predicted phage tail protein